MKTYKQFKVIHEETDPNKKAMLVGIQEEKDAIEIYNDLMLNATDSRVKKLLKHVIEEEEHHIDEFQELLNNLDTVQPLDIE